MKFLGLKFRAKMFARCYRVKMICISPMGESA